MQERYANPMGIMHHVSHPISFSLHPTDRRLATEATNTMAMAETQNAAPVSTNEKVGNPVVTKEEQDNVIDSEAQPVAKAVAST